VSPLLPKVFNKGKQMKRLPSGYYWNDSNEVVKVEQYDHDDSGNCDTIYEIGNEHCSHWYELGDPSGWILIDPPMRSKG